MTDRPTHRLEILPEASSLPEASGRKVCLLFWFLPCPFPSLFLAVSDKCLYPTPSSTCSHQWVLPVPSSQAADRGGVGLAILLSTPHPWHICPEAEKGAGASDLPASLPLSPLNPSKVFPQSRPGAFLTGLLQTPFWLPSGLHRLLF